MASSRTLALRILASAACSAAALLASGTTALAQTRQPLPIAYVSIQRILAEADEAKAAGKELEALRVSKGEELSAKKRALDASKLQLANSGGLFSGSKRQELADQVKRQETELQQATQQAQTDFQEHQKKAQQQLGGEVNKIINAMAQERGVQYVLSQDVAILLAPAGANWTAEVLQRLNAASGGKKSASDKPTAEPTPANKPGPKTP
jgi:Skp family chaperone for outer membrane proteins